MTKARDIADLGAVTSRLDTVGASDGALSNRNLIINGAMQVAQRGTSFTGLSNGNTQYTLDRWRWTEGGVSSFVASVTQDTSAPDGFASSCKIAITTANASLGSTETMRLMYKIEGQDLQQTAFGTSSAKNLTLSFWVKSNKTGTYIAWLYNNDAARHISRAYTVDAADTWEYKTLTIDGDTVSGFDNDNLLSMQLEFVLAAGSNYTSGTLATTWQADDIADRYVGNVNLADSTSNYWQITGVQLEVGDTATPFEHRSYGDELQRCARYCYRWTNTAGVSAYLAVGMARTTTNGRFNAPLPTPMRTATLADLTLTSSGTWQVLEQGTSQTVTSFTHAGGYENTFAFTTNVASGFATGDALHLRSTTANAYIQLDAEL